MNHTGGCHCGNLRVEMESAIDPAEIEVRACQCSFCLKHASNAVADPDGRLSIRIADPDRLSRYSFGLRTAEFLVCRECGVYVAAVTAGDDSPRGLVVVSALDDRKRFTRPPIAVDYDAEVRSDRVARRRERWMPVDVTLGASTNPASAS